ncbi:MAG: glycoside hydrolase family protein [Polyangiaceae bacterium]|nr:glycoside hydrolase family protein [Polyangiaceae bacterium]
MEEELIRYLRFNEGVRLSVYNDQLGIPTIGVGFNLDRADARQCITELGFDYDAVRAGSQSLSNAAVNELLEQDVAAVLRAAPGLVPNFADLGPARQIVVADMIFNLGPTRFAGFRRTIAAIQAGDWGAAAAEMRNSVWFNQVGPRGVRNEAAMRTNLLVVGGIDNGGDLKVGKEGKEGKEGKDSK